METHENPYRSPEEPVEEEGLSVGEYLRRMRWVRWGLGVLQWSMILLGGMYGLMMVPELELVRIGLWMLAVVGMTVGIFACDRCPKEVLPKRPRFLNTAGVLPVPLLSAVTYSSDAGRVIAPVLLLVFWIFCVLMGIGLWQLARGLECETGKKQSIHLALFSGVICTLMLAAMTEAWFDPRGMIAWAVGGAGLLIFIVLLLRTLETLRRWITVKILDKNEVS